MRKYIKLITYNYKKYKRYLLIGVIALFVLYSLKYLIKSNSGVEITYEMVKLEKRSIEKVVIAAGKIIPKREIEIKPNISGIIQEIYVEEGQEIKKDDLIANISVIANMSQINLADSKLKNARIALENNHQSYKRQKILFDQGIISVAEFQKTKAEYDQSKQNLRSAQRELSIVKTGTASGLGGKGNTLVKATSDGIVLDIPVEIGFQVTEANTFSAGTTIASIADLGEMVFKGNVDESEVGQIKLGMSLNITVGAIPDVKFKSKLNFISPKGVDNSGVIQFEVKGNVNLIDSLFIRSGYSANASIITDKRDSVWTLEEAHLQFDEDKNPYVEIKKGKNEFEKKYVTLGLSDNKHVEILSGIGENDKIKIWNQNFNSKKELE